MGGTALPQFSRCVALQWRVLVHTVQIYSVNYYMETKAQKKRIEKGEQLYEQFVEDLAETFGLPNHVANPLTNTLELFALLSKNQSNLLHKEMAKEYFTNFLDIELRAVNGRIVSKVSTWEPI